MRSPGTPPAEALGPPGWLELLAWAARRRRLIRVSGHSMEPVLEPGDEVLIDPRAKPRIGDIVVARHPFRTDVHVIKRIVGFDAAGRAELRGDNPSESSDSRTLGNFGPELLLGRVCCRLPSERRSSGGAC